MKHIPHWMRWAVLAAIAAVAMLVAEVLAQNAAMSFFVTSTGLGKGADLGGLVGADRHCQTLATSAGAGRRSQPDGRAFAGEIEMTCRNWTHSGEGAAMVGHHDRVGIADDEPNRSWNSSHPSRGCSQDALKGTGGNGLFYCFAAN